MDQERIPDITIGEILRLDYMEPIGLTPEALAAGLGVDLATVQAVLSDERLLDADMALRLARFYSTSVEFWLGMQAHCLARMAEHADPTPYQSIRPLAAA